jgi:hypothetical protein
MAKQMSYTLFTEKYRPSRVEDMLLPGNYKTFFKELVKDVEVPNLLLYSSTPEIVSVNLSTKSFCD